MALLEIPRALLVGIGFGVVGISFWIVGIFVFRWLLQRYGSDEPRPEPRP